jgi:benzoylformate decarboxylase
MNPGTTHLSDAMLALLRSEGVELVFGNPGTTELPLLDAIARAEDLTFVLALHEGSAVAMADGYARASGSVGFVSLHGAFGVANGLSALLNARRSRTPLVVAAGQQDRRHLDQQPMLAEDVVTTAGPACKSAVEVHVAHDLPRVLRRAFDLARTPPEGPVLVSIPVDVLSERLDEPLPERSVIHTTAVAGGVDAAAAVLAQARRPAIVAGEGIGREHAMEVAVELAEVLRATVYLQPMYEAVAFPATHPLVAGELPPNNAAIESALDGHDVVLIAGARAFAPHYYSQRRAVAPGVRLVQLDSDPAQVGRNHSVEIGLVGGLAPTMRALVRAIQQIAGTVAGPPPSVAAPAPGVPITEDGTPLSAGQAGRVIAAALPADAILVEEAVTSSRALREAVAPSRPGGYHRSSAGALGWGLGSAVGVKLARPDRPVVAVVADGAAAYGMQALWTAAHYGVGTVFVVLDNREYHAVRRGLGELGVADATGYPGIALGPPWIEWAELASSMGVHPASPRSAAEISRQIAAALDRPGPSLIHVRITSARPAVPSAV